MNTPENERIIVSAFAIVSLAAICFILCKPSQPTLERHKPVEREATNIFMEVTNFVVIPQNRMRLVRPDGLQDDFACTNGVYRNSRGQTIEQWSACFKP